MSLISLCHRALIVAIVVLSSITYAGTVVKAQYCMCPPDKAVTKQIKICLDQQDRFVNVTYCFQKFCPDQPLTVVDPCNPQNNPIHARTVISRICPVGFTTTNAQGLMNATVAAMGYCCGDQAELFNCSAATAGYRWIVRWPKCVFFDANNCLVGCPGSPCCGFYVGFFPNVPVQGQCTTVVFNDCSDVGVCNATCGTQLTCTYPVQCCW